MAETQDFELTEPYLLYVDKDGFEVETPLDIAETKIGRLRENEIYKHIGSITRLRHCSVKTITNDANLSSVWLTDSSKNGTWLDSEGNVKRIEKGKEIQLFRGDTIMILTGVNEDKTENFWRLQLHDAVTRIVERPRPEGNLIITLLFVKSLKRLHVLKNNLATESIHLTPLEFKLVDYMDSQNQKNGGTPILCDHEALITAVWGDNYNRTRNDLNCLIRDLRKKVYLTVPGVRFMENQWGSGFILYVSQ